jgi:predicted  nucleic acid-binding Zn-ribbon protein
VALRKFKCEKCGHEWSRLLKDQTSECPRCGTSNQALLPVEVNSTIYETRDRYRGTQLRKNQERMMRKRMRDHHDRYELAEKIDKYGLDDAKRYGWLKKIKKI